MELIILEGWCSLISKIDIWKNFLNESYRKVSDFPFISKAAPRILKRVQEEYNAWQVPTGEQDDYENEKYEPYFSPDGYEQTEGGLCHIFADIIVDEISKEGIEIYSVSSCHEQHVYTVFRINEGDMAGVYQLDIPYSVYETGGGFSWKKIKDVEFNVDDFYIYKLDSDPGNIKDYVEDYEEDVDF